MEPVTITNITKKYGNKAVLDDVSLSLEKGKIFGLIGLNGVGKTTLIKILLDLLKADSGTIQIFGESHLDAKSRRNLCYLPEKFMPSPYLKGHEFLSLTSAYYHRSYSKEQGEEKAIALDLKPEALAQKVSRYSKGMGQKLGLISTLLSETPLLILDEPMSGLDPKARIYLKRALQAYRDKGHTIFFSSHILADMEQICDRIAVLHEGKILFNGTPAAFKKTYHAKGRTLEETFLAALEGEAA
jgi:ABC-2 type transport system ATP-binding protein